MLKKLLERFFRPSRRRMINDASTLHNELKAFDRELLPWKSEEIELLALEQNVKRKKRSGRNNLLGSLNSIYEEPMFSVNYKWYNQDQSILVARSSNRRYTYLASGGEVNIYVNGHHLGKLKQGVYYKQNKAIAKYNWDKNEAYNGIWINDKEVAQFINPKESTKFIPRAVEIMDKMNEGEETVFVSILVFLLFKKVVLKR